MLCHSVPGKYTDPHLDKDIPMCGSGPKTCVLSISRVHEGKNVVKVHNGMQTLCTAVCY